MKLTIKEFFESKEKLAIHTHTEEEAIKLCKAIAKAGYIHDIIGSYYDVSYWECFKTSTCYSNKNGYADKECYKQIGYTILKISDIDFGKDEN